MSAAADDRETCRTHSLRGEHEEISACSRLIERNPDDADAYYHRGEAYKHKLDYDAAIAGYSEAIRLNPNVPLLFDRSLAN